MLEQIKKLINEFEAIQSKYAKYGAYDSEPDGVFQCLLKKALYHHDVTIPETGEEWELYTSSMDCEAVAKELHDKASEVVQAVIEGMNDEYVNKFILDYCWR